MSRKRQGAKYFPHALPGAQMTTLSYDYGDGEDIAPHYHDEDQLVFACTGVMTIQTEDGVWIVPPQRAVWIPGNVVHSIRNSGTVSMRTLYFLKKFVRNLPRKCFVMNVTPLLRELILHSCGSVKWSVKNAKEKRIIELIIDHVDSRNLIPLQLPLPFDGRARRVAEILIADPSDGRSFDELCREAGASKRTIERVFQDQTNMTVGKWRQQLRMMNSIQMLATGEKIIHVALENGYGSPSAFTSAFRKVLGKPPSHFFTE